MRVRKIELPSLESLPQAVCRVCGKSKICGLFTPGELSGTSYSNPRCRACMGEINTRRLKGRP